MLTLTHQEHRNTHARLRQLVIESAAASDKHTALVKLDAIFPPPPEIEAPEPAVPDPAVPDPPIVHTPGVAPDAGATTIAPTTDEAGKDDGHASQA